MSHGTISQVGTYILVDGTNIPGTFNRYRYLVNLYRTLLLKKENKK
jgi:hypothetical protein